MSNKIGFDIDHVAALSRLVLTDEEKKIFAPQLAAVLEYFKKLQEVPTDTVKPTFHVIAGLTNRFQEQPVAADTLGRDEVLANAPLTKDGYIQTNAVL